MKRCVISWLVCFSLILTQQQQQQHQDEKTSSVCERVHTTSPTKHRHSSTQRGTQTGERAQAEMETKKAQQPLDQSESPTHTRRAAAMVWLGVRWLGWFIRSFLLFAFWSTAASDEKNTQSAQGTHRSAHGDFEGPQGRDCGTGARVGGRRQEGGGKRARLTTRSKLQRQKLPSWSN